MESASSGRLRVVLFSNLFPTPSDPTRGIFNFQLARELQKLCDVTVVCPLPWFPRLSFFRRFTHWYSFAEVPRRYTIGGIEVLSPKYPMLPKVSGAIHAWLLALGARKTLVRLHLDGRCDIINAHWLYPDAVAAEHIASQLGVPVVPAALGCDVNRMFDELDKRERIFAMLRRAPRIIAVSAALSSKIEQLGIDIARTVTIPNGVDTSVFRPMSKPIARSLLGLPPQREGILFIGRFSEEKGLYTLIDACSIMREAGRDFVLYLIGEGPLRTQLESKIEGLRLMDRVRFVGQLPQIELPNWLAACDVFCLPSLREGCPNVVNEAMACGRPVVASSVGGIPEMVRKHCGILVTPQDPEKLAAALSDALSRRWSEVEISAEMETNSWNATACRYLKVFDDTLANSPTAIKTKGVFS
jgi:teichuronic acid biosynthesis glycosyltransferase TuaC